MKLSQLKPKPKPFIDTPKLKITTIETNGKITEFIANGKSFKVVGNDILGTWIKLEKHFEKI